MPTFKHRGCLFAVCLIALASLFVSPYAAVADAAGAASYQPGPLLEAMLDSDMSDVDEIVFAVRVSGRDHWYVNFGYYSCDYGDPAKRSFGIYPDGESLRGYGDGGRLCRLNLRTGKLTVLLDDPKGGVRDPQMHYDGKKILFSYRPGDTATYHLYEINIDGTALTQLTDGPDDDIEPTYLPDGSIMFGSSRCRRFVNCWFSRVATLYRCDADGSNIRLVSSNNDHDNTPWVLPDGRILYMRWEYVDRSQVHFHHLWTVNPDGTGQMTFYGNMFSGTAMLDAKPIDGSDKIVSSFSPGHGRTEHMGHVTVVDPTNGPDDPNAARNISKSANFRDPYGLSETCFLTADKRGIHVMDGQGKTELVYHLPASDAHMECHEPRPLRGRARERIIAPRVDLAEKTGRLFLADIYHGRNMEGIRRGEIKKLLVLEQLPMPVHFSGGMESISMGGTFTLARILGTVPVEEDGSALFEVPALRSLFFVALDENDLSVKRMQSFVTVQPGETSGCVGCHEQRTQTVQPTTFDLIAYKHRRPNRIEPIEDVPAPIDFPRDVQPVLDEHCVECHNPDRYDGRVDLTGDHLSQFSVSYYTIRRLNLVADGRNQPFGNRDARTIGSSASRLLKLMDGSHYEAKPSDHERKVVRLWIDASANYAGTYACLGCGVYHAPLPVNVLTSRCASCHRADKGHIRNFRGQSLQSVCNLDRPEKSLVLRAPLSKDAGGLGICGPDVFKSTDDLDYKRLLAGVRAGAQQLADGKRFDMPGFRPNRFYIREMKRFGFLPRDLKPDDPVDHYATDQAYWNSFWWLPGTGGAE